MFQYFRKINNCKVLGKRRSVTTWSVLATAFNNATKSDMFGIRMLRKETGLFGIPNLKTAAGFDELKQRAIYNTELLIEEATSPNRTRKMVEIFDDLSDTLCRVADLAEFIRIAHPEKEFVLAAEDACISLSGVVEKLNTHRELYGALAEVVQHGDVQSTTAIDDHVAKLFLFDFEQCGIHLPEKQREKVVDLNDYILQVGQRFMSGAVTARIVGTSALPDNVKQYFTTQDGNIIVQGLYTDSPNALAREAAYKIFLHPDPKQDYLLTELLNARHELARICGFPTYVHRAVRRSTVESPEVVNDFLNILNKNIWDKANEDYEIMQKMKNAETFGNEKLMVWDTAYFMAKAKKSWLNASNSDFAPYFSLGACMDGLNILTQALYGIKLESVPVETGEVWANNVKKIAVIDESNVTLGHIYCDFFERDGKPNQDCHFTIRGGRRLSDGSYQNPVVVLMLSLPNHSSSGPCLLNPSSVDNLFHEMGHALHSMLGRTRYQHVTGTRCSTDFAEVPSVLMEYFASDPRVVGLFARHYETQEKMPREMLEKLCASKNMFPASEMQNQVFYSMLDHVYHSNQLETSTTEILAHIQSRFYGLPYVSNTAWQLRFSHLVGYGAKYYSYLISRAIASWIWQTYFQADPFSRSAGEKYRHECLAHGGSKPPSKLVSDFLNKEATAKVFAESLINEIDIKNDTMKDRK